MEIHALARAGWSVSAISRHTGRDRKTIRKYLAGAGAGQRRERAPSCLEPFRDYIQARFADDPHMDATVLHRELVEAGFDRSYPTLVRELRRLELRPVCLVCQHRRGRAVTVEIEHPPGEEIQWDWLELDRDAVGRAGVRARRRAVALGPLPRRVLRADDLRAPRRGDAPGARRAGRHAAGLADRPDGHDRDPRHRPAHRRRRAGGQALRRRDRGLPAAARAAQGRRRGRDQVHDPVVVAQRPGHARWPRRSARWIAGASRSPTSAARPGGTVGELGAGEPLRALPAAAYPALIAVERKASRSALVAFEGNRYSVAPGYAARTVTVRARVGEPLLRILSAAGELVATHRRAPAGAGQTIRSAEHAAAARAGGPGRVHDRPRLPAQGQPAARPGRARRARAPEGHHREPGAGRSTSAATPPSPRSRADGRHRLPAAARAPRTTCA